MRYAADAMDTLTREERRNRRLQRLNWLEDKRAANERHLPSIYDRKGVRTKSTKGAILQYQRRLGRELREAREVAMLGFHTQQQWLWRIELYGWQCIYCGAELTVETLTKDHRIPVARRGTNWASNLVPACRPCNSWKGAREVKVLG
jgi:5-methylcytosine-specific restriction endonuclease McrA